jgi:hypothetical protein
MRTRPSSSSAFLVGLSTGPVGVDRVVNLSIVFLALITCPARLLGLALNFLWFYEIIQRLKKTIWPKKSTKKSDSSAGEKKTQ